MATKTKTRSTQTATNGSSPNGSGSNSQAHTNGHGGLPDSVVVEDFITVRDLAKKMQRSPIDLIKVLMQFGIMAPITHNIDHETAVIIGEELDVLVEWPEEEIEEEELESPAEEQARIGQQGRISEALEREQERNLVARSPVVAVLGHVDHGKTSLLDYIRKESVAEGEAGGITQRTGAYQAEYDGRKITFLDTPGHEAFTNMRARGAQVTDIVVLVVAADDGLMPQTREAINHARAAGVQLVVALNKIDKANANQGRVLDQLSQEGLIPETYGGETIVVPVSAMTGEGIDELLENLLVVAELEEYKANPKGRVIGTVIESELDKQRGVTATLLVQNGTLKRGDSIYVDKTWGRIKAMFDYEGNQVKQAGPSEPVVVLGLHDVPPAGSIFERASKSREAQRIAEERQLEAEEARSTTTPGQMTLEDLFSRFEGGETKTLNLIVRSDMQGTLEPVVASLNDLSNDEITVHILQSAVGNINESDVMLAEASDAVIIGFSVDVDKSAQARAENSGVEMRLYNIIYKLLEEVEAAMVGMLDPIYEDVTIGHARVLQLFTVRKSTIAGCQVTDGLVKRGVGARVLRNGEVIVPESRITTLRRFTEDVNEVRTGFECGINISEGDGQLQEDDVIEIYESQRIR